MCFETTRSLTACLGRNWNILSDPYIRTYAPKSYADREDGGLALWFHSRDMVSKYVLTIDLSPCIAC